MPTISTNELSSIVIGLVCIPITPLEFATKTISSISVIVDVIVINHHDDADVNFILL